MSRILVLFIAFFFLFSVQSCKQCETCTTYPGSTQKICRDAYDTNDSYTAAVNLLKSQGYTCH